MCPGEVPDLKAAIQVPFHSEEDAGVAYNTLKVDREPPRGGCKRTLSVGGMSVQSICLLPR